MSEGRVPVRASWCHAAVCACLAIVLIAGCRSWSAKPHPRAKSFILLVIDTLRADHVGAYGSQRNLTPALDELASESYVFENPIVTSSWTKSSIASMITSEFPSALGVLGRQDSISETAITLAEAFKERGYQTLGVTTNGNAGASFGFAQGFDAFVYPKMRRGYPGDVLMYPAEGVTQTALDWLKDRPADSPFFLFLHYTDPHDAYLPHEGLLPDPEPPGRFDGSRQQLEQLDHASDATEVDRARIRYLYAGEVKYCDLWVGKLIKGLRHLGVWDDVMLVVTADHGEGLWDHGLRAHGFDLYEEIVRIPLVVRYPRMSYGDARRIGPPVSLVDLAPTFLAAAEITPPAAFRGRDLWPLIAGQERPNWENGVYTELGLDGHDLEAVRTASHKLIRDRTRAASHDAAFALFDVSNDPKERLNLMGSATETAAGLRATLSGWRIALASEGPVARPDTSFDQLSESDLDSLKALGYLRDEEHQAALQRKRAEKKDR